MRLLDILMEQKNMHLPGQLYEFTQIDMAYNSNRIEGSTLTLAQTSLLYTDKLVSSDDNTKLDEYVEMNNHFSLFDYMLDTADEPLSEELIKRYHSILKNGTEDSKRSWFAVGEYKRLNNQVGLTITTSAEDTPAEMRALVASYNGSTLGDFVRFHAQFEHIHPFQDGNGRIGRILLFKECLKNDVMPLIVTDGQKQSYYNGLQEYYENPKKLTRTMEQFQKRYRAKAEAFVGDLMDKGGTDEKDL